jgi:hypothetical protein
MDVNGKIDAKARRLSDLISFFCERLLKTARWTPARPRDTVREA